MTKLRTPFAGKAHKNNNILYKSFLEIFFAILLKLSFKNEYKIESDFTVMWATDCHHFHDLVG